MAHLNGVGAKEATIAVDSGDASIAAADAAAHFAFGAALRAYRLSQIAAAAILTALIVWALTLITMIKDINNLGTSFDAVVRSAQIFGSARF